MKNTAMTGLLALVCALPVAWAADTPSNMGPNAQEHMVAARAAMAAKNWTKAIAELNAAVKTEPRNADAHNLLGYSHRKQARPDLAKAFEHYKLALQIDPGHKGAHEYIGEAYLMDKRPADAEKHLAELARICGNQTCEEYADLAKAIAAYKARAPG
ncbi:tetratricopeptide repeat protein [Hydrogenophaga sp. PBL-H3]|uniref:tetratricopeptide repeat protein n=1 Tax=Hydrogenophaga sp. PBL-H3 TaxID=434010 RepID=UPI00131F4F66|nr:tetratricopeptide repeat protein [Hydrogenophaga sp. PBL-H3]QHE75630.1 tetratricopeptide repeat protein [Hydrogenophaga sp. PBL-H3]QHE80056.1 tetratricopeptide repeat protein [Hydrogenophaga sp. PBL-H3]